MKPFQVRVLRAGVVVQETRLAPSEAVLRAQSRLTDERLLAVTAQWQWRPAQVDWLVVVEQMLFLLKAGLNITETLRTLVRKERRPLPRTVLHNLLEQIEAGRRLSAALQEVDPQVDYLLLSTIASNEDSGTLTDALSRYLLHAQQMQETRRQISGVLIYPAILSIAGLLIFTFLLLYVMPRFSHIFDNMTGELPWMSQLLLSIGTFAESYRWSLLGLLLGGPLLLAASLTQTTVRRALWQALLRWSPLAERLYPLTLARLYHMLALLTLNGMPLHQTLLGLAVHYQDSLQSRLQHTIRQLEEGVALSDALHDAQLTDEILDSLLRAGERSGNIGDCFAGIANLLDGRNRDLIRRFSKVFEPLLMLGLGLAIGAIVVLMYLPIFELASTLQ